MFLTFPVDQFGKKCILGKGCDLLLGSNPQVERHCCNLLHKEEVIQCNVGAVHCPKSCLDT